MGCSRPLPLQQLGPASRDLGLAADGQQEFSSELHSLSVQQVLEQFGQGLLSNQVEPEAYQAKLDWLEQRLLALVNELKAGLNQGKQALRRAEQERLEIFLSFESEARPMLNDLLEHFLECLGAMRELGQTRDPGLLQEALSVAAEGMMISQQYEQLCLQVESELYPG